MCWGYPYLVLDRGGLSWGTHSHPPQKGAGTQLVEQQTCRTGLNPKNSTISICLLHAHIAQRTAMFSVFSQSTGRGTEGEVPSAQDRGPLPLSSPDSTPPLTHPSPPLSSPALPFPYAGQAAPFYVPPVPWKDYY